MAGFSIKEEEKHPTIPLSSKVQGEAWASRLQAEHCHEKTCSFAYAKSKAQISCVVTAQLIRVFVFANPSTKFQASNHLLWLYSPV